MENKVKKAAAGIVLYVLLVVCIGLMASPLLKYFILEREGSKYQFGTFSADELAENIEAADDVVMERDISIPDMVGILKHMNKADRKDVIGCIAIESAGLYLPIFNGTTKENLMVGAGTMQPEQEMGKGNYCLAGHHMKDKKLLFGPLVKVKEGDWIHLSDKKNVYTYEVNKIDIIHQSDIEVMAEGAASEVTLITCDKTGVNTDNRLMVRGELVNISEEDGKDSNQYLESFHGMETAGDGSKDSFIWIWAAGVAAAAGILLFLVSCLLKVNQEEIR